MSEENKTKQEQSQKLAPEDIEDKRKMIIILEKAPLETAMINRKLELLNCDDHRKFIANKLKKDYSKYRPDIVHQVYFI